MRSIKDAQEDLPALLQSAQSDVIGLTDDDGTLVGLIAGLDFDDVDDLLVETPGFKQMIVRAQASLRAEGAVPAEVVEAEARARLAAEEAESNLNVAITTG